MEIYKFRLSVLWFLIVSFATTEVVLCEELSRGIVKVTAETDGAQTKGTGFVVARKETTVFISTALHNVEGTEKISIDFPDDPTETYIAEFLRLDERTDLALLRLKDSPSGIKPLPISESLLEPGKTFTAVGYPTGSYATRYTTVTLSGLEGSVLMMTGEIDRGYSGGPVLDLASGVVVGLVSQKEGVGLLAVPGQILHLILRDWLPDELLPGVSVPDPDKVVEDEIFECTIHPPPQITNAGKNRISINGEYEGVMNFAPFKSNSVRFDCEEGQHSFNFEIRIAGLSGEGSCSGAFRVQEDRTVFFASFIFNPTWMLWDCRVLPFL